MLLIAEIILTFFAWRKGWKWWALLPLGIAGGIGLIWGLIIGALGGTINNLPGWSVVFDIMAVVALIVLCSVKPKSKELSKPTDSSINV
jgi:MFS family permease